MNNENTCFSIVVVNYNGAQYLESCILSIINQNYKRYELIIVDGKSTDNSIDIIKKYEKNIRWWVSEEDNGQSEAFNKGFKMANGNFLFWINADDLLLPNSLSIAAKYIEKFPEYSWFTANTMFFTKDGSIIRCSRGPKWINLIKRNSPINVYGPTSIFKKKLFEIENGFDETLFYTMDTDLWMRFTRRGMKFKRIPHYFWGFRQHELSKTSHAFSHKPNRKFAEERIKIQKKNDHIYSFKGIFIQKIFKFFNGLYFRSLIDSKKYFGKNINQL